MLLLLSLHLISFIWGPRPVSLTHNSSSGALHNHFKIVTLDFGSFEFTLHFSYDPQIFGPSFDLPKIPSWLQCFTCLQRTYSYMRRPKNLLRKACWNIYIYSNKLFSTNFPCSENLPYSVLNTFNTSLPLQYYSYSK